MTLSSSTSGTDSTTHRLCACQVLVHYELDLILKHIVVRFCRQAVQLQYTTDVRYSSEAKHGTRAARWLHDDKGGMRRYADTPRCATPLGRAAGTPHSQHSSFISTSRNRQRLPPPLLPPPLLLPPPPLLPRPPPPPANLPALPLRSLAPNLLAAFLICSASNCSCCAQGVSAFSSASTSLRRPGGERARAESAGGCSRPHY